MSVVLDKDKTTPAMYGTEVPRSFSSIQAASAITS